MAESIRNIKQAYYL